MKLLSMMALLLGTVLPAQTSRPEAANPPRGLERWETFDLEAKWAAYRRSLLRGDSSKETWVAWLRRSKEFELLEWMVVFGGWNDAFSKGSPGLALAEENAPQWIRAALWNLKSGDSHNKSAAEQMLLAHAAEVWGWLEKYPKAKPLAQKILTTFNVLQRQNGLEPGDPGDALPPLDPVTLVLPYLDAPKDLPELGDLPKAKRSGRYLHQVLRGLAGVASGSLWAEPYRGKVLRLTRHPHGRVRQAAFLTFTKFPAGKVPYQRLLAAFAKEGGRKEDRQHALLALSYSEHPAANLLLHEVAVDVGHPCWDVALSRLGDTGNQFTVTFVRDGIGVLILSRDQRLVLGRELQAIHGRKINWSTELRAMLERAAWAKLTKKPYADTLARWTLGQVRAQNQKGALRSLLQGLAREYVPAEVMSDRKQELGALVRGWAKELAKGRTR